MLRPLVFVLFILFLISCFSTADGSSGVAATEPTSAGDPRDDGSPAQQDPQVVTPDTESLTMTIPLDEGGVIDVEAPPMGVKIEKWSGDEVLLIVEKTKRTKANPKNCAVDPVNIQVSRKGKDVRIETSGGRGWEENGMNLSFRIVLPDRYDEEPVVRHTRTETAARLTGVLWRALHNEALDWLTR
jgi:hypothetical protein